jgi:hypothetical protein
MIQGGIEANRPAEENPMPKKKSKKSTAKNKVSKETDTKKKAKKTGYLKKKTGINTGLIQKALDNKKHTSGDKKGDLLTEIQVARDTLFLIYMKEMRHLAKSYLKLKGRPQIRNKKATATMGANDLINTAYLKLWGKKTPKTYDSTELFLAVFLKTMKRIAIDNFRRRKTREDYANMRYELSKGEINHFINDFPNQFPGDGELYLLLADAIDNYKKEKPIKALAFELKYEIGETTSRVSELLRPTTDRLGLEPINVDKLKRWLNKKKPGPVIVDMRKHLRKLGYEN